ncbi:MAG: FecR domain-containing protein, partial [Chthoniobacterales bacterium]
MKIRVAAALLTLASGSIQAGPLTEARVARIINDVAVIKPADGAHPAALNEVIKDHLAVKTGIKSRSELLFQDDTLTRLGPESLFSFKTGTRDMSLERGAMLLQVPKGIGGAQIHTAAVTASITGTTIMLEHVPGKSLKVLVLEG